MKFEFVLPSDWAEKRLDDVTVLMTNGFVGTATTHYTDDPDGITYIQGFNVTKNGFNLSGVRKVTREFHEKNKKSILQEGDLLTIQTGDIGLTIIVPKELAGSNCHALVITRLDRKLCYPPFYAQLFNSPIFRRLFRRIETGSSMKHLNVGDIKRLTVPAPPLYEQKAIADLLSTWDEAIEKTERLIRAKERRFKAIVQRLIGQKCREWPHVRPSELFDAISEKNYPEEELLSVTQDRGVIPRRLLEGRVMSPESGTANYKRIKKGDFAISLRSFQGGIEYSEYQGIISPAYTVLRPKKLINPDFYKLFFKTYLFIEKYLSIAVIGIRDGKQISIPDFMSIKIPAPPLDEQKRIAEVLSTARKEIDLLSELAKCYKKQKRGLMQNLLTGQWRVPLSQSNTNQRELSPC